MAQADCAGPCLPCRRLRRTLVATAVQCTKEHNITCCVRLGQRQKEILRNKKERRFQRDAHALKANPDAIKEELKEVNLLALTLP